MEVLILSGIAGSGKSTYARNMVAEDRLGTQICSADDYFTGKDGSYDFDGSKLGDAHNWCFAQYIRQVQREYYLKRVIVDNTNLEPIHVAPYVAVARAFGVPWKLIQVGCDPEVAATRNVHGVPRSKVLKMYERLQNFYAPKEWWKNVTATGDLAFVSNLARRNYEQQQKT